jgi:hypothetical protein
MTVFSGIEDDQDDFRKIEKDGNNEVNNKRKKSIDYYFTLDINATFFETIIIL